MADHSLFKSATSPPLVLTIPVVSLKDPFLGLYCFPFMLPLHQVIHKFNISFHFYADDTPIYFSINPSDLSTVSSLLVCLAAISSWMSNNFVMLSSDKTEVMVFGPSFGDAQTLIHAFIVTTYFLDCPKKSIDQLQLVKNTAARFYGKSGQR